MELEVYSSPNNLYLRIAGRIILDDVETFKTVVYPLLDQAPPQIAVDLEKAVFIDSAGLGALVGMKTRSSKSASKFALVNPSPEITEVLTISKLITIFDVLTGLNAKTLAVTAAKEHYRVYP